MTNTVVPYSEVSQLLALVLQSFAVRYGINIDPSAVSYTIIQPRQDFKLGLEITTNVSNDFLAIRVYMNFVFDSRSELSEFLPEQVQNTNQGNTPVDNRFVCLASLPRRLYPIMSSTTWQPDTTVQSVSFNPSTYSANSGQTIDLTVTISGAPGSAVSVHYATQNGTATGGTDYQITSGTLNWSIGDSASKTISIPTGQSYYYYWKPQSFSYSDVSAYVSTGDGLTIGYTTNSGDPNNIYAPDLRTKTDVPGTGTTIYHEFEVDSLANPFTLELTAFVEGIYNSGTSNGTNQFGLTANFDSGTSAYIFNAFIPNFTYVAVLPAPIAALPFRVGFLFDEHGNAKMHINGNWIDFVNGDGGAGTVPTQNQASAIGFSAGQTFDTITGLSIDQNMSNNSGWLPDSNPHSFSMTAKVGSSQLYRPSGALSPTAKNLTTSGGQFTVVLSSPSGVTIGTSTATATINDGNVCYLKLITNNDETGFVGGKDQISGGGTTLIDFDWSESTSGCGSNIDVRATATNVPPNTPQF
jgi:hypothetical protein